MGDLGSVAVLRGDARSLPLPDASVDLIVTSPPYWALRSYQDGGRHYDGQIGAEPTPGEYVDALVDCTREWMRVLKPTGSLFVNLGDAYNSTSRQAHRAAPAGPNAQSGNTKAGVQRHTYTPTLKVKSLLGLPERYMLRCIDDLGLILRAKIVWSKPNGLPESVTDRVRRSHEDWFHFTLQPRYYAAVDEIREPVRDYHGRPQSWQQRRAAGEPSRQGEQRQPTAVRMAAHPLGALPGSVWEIATQPLTVPAELGVDHYAAFPIEWPRRIIAGWSPPGICTACGEGRRPTTAAMYDRQGRTTNGPKYIDRRHESPAREVRAARATTITGYACACPAPTAPITPALVLDPFGGTGTTALAARALGRNAISVDMSSDYCRLAAWRTSDPGELARAMGVAKPPPVGDGQMDLLDEVARG